jgi:hypothetical protein
MSWALDEFFAGVEEEFGVSIGGAYQDHLDTPGAVIDFVAAEVPAPPGVSDDAHREQIASVVGELMAQTLGITRYREDSRFVEDLRVR